jgi:hypothetical protein
MTWKVGASKSLPIADTDRSWDGPAARRRMVEAGAGTAKRGHLIYDDEADPETQAAYKLPFADLISGDLKAIPSGLRAAASRLPQTDIPQSVKDDARAVLDAYFERMDSMENKRMTLQQIIANALQRVWKSIRTEVSRDIAMQQIGGQIMSALDAENMKTDNYDEWHFLQDLYVGDANEMYCITISGGKLYKWAVTLDAANNVVSLGAPVMVKPNFETATTSRTISISRREDGRYAAFCVLSTALLNKSSEIDTRKLFDCFVERFKGDGSEYINIYHLGGESTRIGELKAIFRDENVLVGYYVLDDNVVGRAVGETLAADKDGYWGGSIEFMADDEGKVVEVAPDVNVRVFEAGTLQGYSLAPAAHGAAWGTAHLQVRTKMNDTNRKIVAELVGDDKDALTEVESWLEDVNIRTREPGAIVRTADAGQGTASNEGQEEGQEERAAGDAPAADAAAADASAADASQAYEVDDDLVAEIVSRVAESDWGTQIASDHAAILERLDMLEESVTTMQAQISEWMDGSTDASSDEGTPTHVEQNVADMQTQLAGIEEELTRLRVFYEANQPAQRRVFERNPKRTVVRAAPARRDEETDEEVAPVRTVTRASAQPVRVAWKDHGLWSGDKESSGSPRRR